MAPPGSVTQINADVLGAALVLQNVNPSGGALQADNPVNISVNVNGDGLFVDNASTTEGSGAIGATARGGHPAIEGVVYPNEMFGGGFGVRGVSSLPGSWQDGPGVGVEGSSGTGIGVLGFVTAGGTGVDGISETGIGVQGETETGTGVEARSGSPDGFALVVQGKSRFSTAGSGVIPVGQNSQSVSNSAVASESHITATLTGSPGSFVSGFPPLIQWLERLPGQGFVIHLTRKVAQATPFTYLIVEPR